VFLVSLIVGQLHAPQATVTHVEAQAQPAKVEVTKPKPKPKRKPVPATCLSEIKKYAWRQDVAVKVARAESGLRTNAVNDNPRTRDYSIGCFQINIYGANARTRPSEKALKNPVTNVAWAWKIYKANGNSFIGQWGVCRYKVRCY